MKNGTDVVTARHEKLRIPAASYVPGITILTLSNKMYHESVIVEDTKLRVIKKTVVLETFYGSSAGRSETVFITENYEDQTGSSNDKNFTCWFGKVPRFIMVVEKGISRSTHSLHRTVR